MVARRARPARRRRGPVSTEVTASTLHLLARRGKPPARACRRGPSILFPVRGPAAACFDGLAGAAVTARLRHVLPRPCPAPPSPSTAKVGGGLCFAHRTMPRMASSRDGALCSRPRALDEEYMSPAVAWHLYFSSLYLSAKALNLQNQKITKVE